MAVQQLIETVSIKFLQRHGLLSKTLELNPPAGSPREEEPSSSSDDSDDISADELDLSQGPPAGFQAPEADQEPRFPTPSTPPAQDDDPEEEAGAQSGIPENKDERDLNFSAQSSSSKRSRPPLIDSDEEGETLFVSSQKRPRLSQDEPGSPPRSVQGASSDGSEAEKMQESDLERGGEKVLEVQEEDLDPSGPPQRSFTPLSLGRAKLHPNLKASAFTKPSEWLKGSLQERGVGGSEQKPDRKDFDFGELKKFSSARAPAPKAPAEGDQEGKRPATYRAVVDLSSGKTCYVDPRTGNSFFSLPSRSTTKPPPELEPQDKLPLDEGPRTGRPLSQQSKAPERSERYLLISKLLEEVPAKPCPNPEECGGDCHHPPDDSIQQLFSVSLPHLQTSQERRGINRAHPSPSRRIGKIQLSSTQRPRSHAFTMETSQSSASTSPQGTFPQQTPFRRRP
jgi:hypothetical protein